MDFVTRHPFLTALILLEFLVFPFGYPVFKGSLKWPSSTITYHDQSGFGQDLERSLAKLNSSGAKLKFIRVPKERAQVIVKEASSPHRCGGRRYLACVTHIGYKPFQKSYMYLPNRFTPRLSEVIAHEFGHVAGLRHKEGCSVMTRALESFKCKAYSNSFGFKYEAGESCLAAWKQRRDCVYRVTDRFLCGPTPEDVKELARLYGGRPKSRYSPYCRSTESFRLEPPSSLKCQSVQSIMKPNCKKLRVRA